MQGVAILVGLVFLGYQIAQMHHNIKLTKLRIAGINQGEMPSPNEGDPLA